MNNATKFAQNLKAARIKSQLTQNEFAERLGVSNSDIEQYENALKQPSFSILTKIADILCVTTDCLLGR